MTIKLHHVAINALDPIETARFYCDNAGFETLKVEGSVHWIATSNFHIAVYTATSADPAAGARKVNQAGIGHFCLQSAIDGDLWDRLDSAGMAFYDRPVALGTGATYAYGRDPEGNLVEVEGVPGEEPVDVWCGHVALITQQIGALAQFYTDLIGREPHRTGRFQHPLFTKVTGLKDVDSSAAWIKTPSVQLELWQYHNPETVGPSPPAVGQAGYRHIAFSCEDLDSETERLSGVGVSLATCETIAGNRAVGTSDPDGNRVVILELDAEGPLSRERLDDPGIVTRRLEAV